MLLPRRCKKSTEYSASNSVFFFKRMMGTDFRRSYGGITYDSAEMSAMVLKKALMNYERITGNVADSAVITMPGDFSDAEKNSIVAAAKMVGIHRLELLNESLSAAIAYRHFSKDTKDRKVIVYDLGGGTLDITVVNIHGNSFNVLSDESSKDLGGRDWDLQLANIIQRKILYAADMKIDDVVSDSELSAYRCRLNLIILLWLLWNYYLVTHRIFWTNFLIKITPKIYPIFGKIYI